MPDPDAGAGDWLSQITPPPPPTPPQPQPPPVVPVDVDGPDQRALRMRASVLAAGALKPDQAAQASAMAARTGVTPAAAVTALPQAKQDADLTLSQGTGMPVTSLAQRHVALSHWLTEPTNAAVARDDMANLVAISTAAQSLSSPAQAAYDEAKAKFDADSRADPLLKAAIDAGERPKTPWPWWAAAYVGGAEDVDGTTRAALYIPAWVQDQVRTLAGAKSEASPWSPRGMIDATEDSDERMERLKARYQTNVAKEVIQSAAGMLEPLKTVILPELGATLAIGPSAALDAALTARKAIAGYAAAQAGIAGYSTAVETAEAERRGDQPSRPITDAANIAVQTALGYAFGRAGSPILRQSSNPFTSRPLAEFAHDTLAFAHLGGTQAVVSASAEKAITDGRALSPGEMASLYATGAVPMMLLSGTNAPDAVAARYHLQALQHAETLQFANKLQYLVDSVKNSAAASTAPAQVGSLIDTIAQPGMTHVFLQSEDWQSHFNAKGEDPYEAAKRAGVADEYVRARGLGADMRIPLRSAVAMAVESADPALIARIRPAANAPTAMEAVKFFQDAKPEDIQKQVAFAKVQAQEAGAGDSADLDQFENQLRESIAASSKFPELAAGHAKTARAFIEQTAERFNAEREAAGLPRVSATDLARQFGVSAVKSLPGVLEGMHEGGQLGGVLDSLRTGGPATPQLEVVRTALRDMGLDATTHTNDEIAGKIREGLTSAKEGIAAREPLVVKGRQVVVTHVPFGGGTSSDGTRVYVDSHIPRFETVKDKRINVHRMIAEHEIAEKERMDRGETYSKAHGEATAIEDADVDHQGVSHQDYEKALKPYLDLALKEHDPAGIPRDIERKPYVDMQQERLLEKAAGEPMKGLTERTRVRMAQDRELHLDERGLAVEARLRAILADKPRADRLYDALPDTDHGKVLDTDLARELSPDFQTREDRTANSVATHDPASRYIQDRYERMMATPGAAGSHVLFLAGGGGSGKGTASRLLAGELRNGADVVYDTVLGNFEKSVKNIELAKASGRKVAINYIHTPFDAALPRAIKRAKGSGRSVPLRALAEAHVKAQETALRLAEKYRADPDVTIAVLDNSSDKPGLGSLEQLNAARYTQGGDDGPAIDRLHASGKEILDRHEQTTPADIIQAFRGQDLERTVAGPDTGRARGAAQGRGGSGGEASQAGVGPPTAGPPTAGPTFTLQQGARGAISITNAGATIHLFQGENASTVAHELGHYMLHVLGTLAAHPDAPAAVKDDFAKIMEFTGYGSLEQYQAARQRLGELQAKAAPTEEETAEAKRLAAPDEVFARTWEDYLRRGVAPSVELRSAFARMKGWLKTLYRAVKTIGAPLNDEITGIFDRMLASDEEIARARTRAGDDPVFTSQEESRLDDEKWAQYQRLRADATRADTDELERKLLAIENRAHTSAYERERAEVREDIAEHVAKSRTYDALRQLQRGETWDGRDLAEPIKIRKDDIERLLTPEERERLPGPGAKANKGATIYTPKAHGQDAEHVAQLLNYGSAHEMLQDFIGAKDRTAHIDELTDQEMLRRHPDPMDNPQQLQDDADHVLHASDIRQQLHDFERRNLARLTRENAREEVKAGKKKLSVGSAELRDERMSMRAGAKLAVQGMGIHDLESRRFVAAERRNAIEVAKAIKGGDYEKALAHKRAQMMNGELARATMEAQDSVRASERRLSRFVKDNDLRAKIAKAGGYDWTVTRKDGSTATFSDPDEQGHSPQEQARREAINTGGTYDRSSRFIDALDHLLTSAGLKTPSPTSRPQVQVFDLAGFVAKAQFFEMPVTKELMPNGFLANVPPEYLAGKIPALRDMTLDQLDQFRTALESIAKMAEYQRELVGVERGNNLLDTVNGLMENLVRFKDNQLGVPKQRVGTGFMSKAMDKAGAFWNSMQLVKYLATKMDGFVGGRINEAGRFFNALIRPANEAHDAKLRMIAALREDIAGALREWGKERPGDPYSLDARKTIPGVDEPMNHWAKIMTLMHYGNVEGRQRLADGYKWDDAKVHAIIDTLDAKDIAFANRMVDILSSHWSDVKALEERLNGVAPKKVEAIPVQTPAGTYKGGYMRLYYDGASTAHLNHMMDDAIQGTMQGRAYRPMTQHGATNERMEHVEGMRPSLDHNDWFRALNEMAHDLTHRELVINQLRILSNKDLARTMIQHWGEGTYRQFTQRIKGLAAGDKAFASTISPFLEHLRVGFNVTHRYLNTKYALKQLMGTVLIPARVNIKDAAISFAQHWSGPLGLDAAYRFAHANSAPLRTRGAMRDSQISGMTAVGPVRKFLDYVGQYAMNKAFSYMDSIAWKAAYNEHMRASKSDHAESVAVANNVMESLMGSNAAKDVADIQRGGGIVQMFTGSMSWSISNLGAIEQALSRIHYGWRNAGDGGTTHIAKGLGSLATLTLMGPLLWDAFDDLLSGSDFKDWAEHPWNHLLSAMLGSTMQSVPGIRDTERAVVEGRKGESLQAMQGFNAITDAAAALHAKRYGEATVKTVAAGAGTLLHLPSGAFIQAWEGYQQGERENADAAHLVWRILNGKHRKE